MRYLIVILLLVGCGEESGTKTAAERDYIFTQRGCPKACEEEEKDQKWTGYVQLKLDGTFCLCENEMRILAKPYCKWGAIK